MTEPTLTEVLADLNRAKIAFQLRAIQTAIGFPAQAIEARRVETERLGRNDESAVPQGIRPTVVGEVLDWAGRGET